MRTRHAILAVMATTAIFGGSFTFAQTTGAPTTGAPTIGAQTTEGGGIQFVTQESDNQWRGSKLIGINVYGPDNVKIGSIREILVSADGTAEVAVIGVGGFLGLGTKDVGLPFKALKWSNDPVQPPAAPGSGSTGAPGAAPPPPAAAPPRGASRANTKEDYPDHAMLDMTKDQLTKAPDFKFAGSTTAAPK